MASPCPVARRPTCSSSAAPPPIFRRRSWPKLEAFLGQDLNGDGVIGGATAPAAGWAPPTATPADDRLAQLERLAHLHATGALTDDEFAREKARLLA